MSDSRLNTWPKYWNTRDNTRVRWRQVSEHEGIEYYSHARGEWIKSDETPTSMVANAFLCGFVRTDIDGNPLEEQPAEGGERLNAENRPLLDAAARIVEYWDANYPGNVQQEKLDSLIHFLRIELDKAQAAKSDAGYSSYVEEKTSGALD